jgi:antitoxin (DNA-binding transcriptional repressor) of toxin-antitoxin stability system
MEIVTIRKANADLSRLIQRACRGEEIVIARGKKPVVRLANEGSGIRVATAPVPTPKGACDLKPFGIAKAMP